MTDAPQSRHYGRPPAPTVAPTLLTLVRHGQTTGNIRKSLSGITDDPLSPLGERQIAATGTVIAALVHDGTLPPVDLIYVSPLTRARQTAAAIAAPLGLTPVIRQELSEIDFGQMEGLTEEEAIARFPEAANAFTNHPDHMTFHFPGGESRRGFHERAKGALANIVAEHPGAHVIVVAHGGVLSVALAHFLAGNTTRWRDYSLGNCSVSRLTVTGRDVTLHCINDLAHLADLTPEEREAVAEIEEIAAKIRRENFDLGSRQRPPDFRYSLGKMVRAAIRQIVAIDARDHDIAQLHLRSHFGYVPRLFRIK